jgi:glycosyltransferase involved in cell wall biosynthesis
MTWQDMRQDKTRKIHILHVIDSLHPATGGPSEVVRALLTFAPSGCTGEAVTLDPPGADFLATYPAPVHALGSGTAPIGFNSKLDRWLEQNRDRFDGAIVHGLWRYIGFSARRALYRRKPYIVFAHGMLDPYFKHRFPIKHLQKSLYWLLSDQRVLRDAACVLFTTPEESSLAEQSFPFSHWTSRIVPLGATRPHKSPEELREAFYHHLPEIRGHRFLLFLGRIHPKKGCDLLVQSFINLATADTELHLLLAGPDQQGWSAQLQQTITLAGLSHRVHWPGMLKDDVKWGAFCAAEAFILPSHQENFGIAVAEALACGRAVLLSDKINIAAAVAHDGAGLVAPDTQQGTDDLLTTWIALSTDERAEMERCAITCFEQRYDMSHNAKAVFRLFRDLVPVDTSLDDEQSMAS